MKLASDDETLAENKVLILYVLEKANKPLTNDVLYKIVLAAVDMNYFYFQQQADTNLKPILDSSEEEQSIVAEYTPLSENHYTIICKVVENNETVFEVKTFAGSREQAKEIVDNWQNNADSIYPKILDILTKKQ